MNVPENLKYTKDHEWAKIEGDVATIGITEYAQGELGDVMYIELPAVGTSVEQGSSFGSIEAVKAASDLYAPVSGEIIEVNEALNDEPEKVNASPFDEGWFVKIKMSNPDEANELLDSGKYSELL